MSLADANGMVRSGLVVTFDGAVSEPSLRGALANLNQAGELWCGEAIGSLLPVVLMTDDPRAGADLLRELERLEFVRKVDVVAIDFGAEEQA